MIGRSFVSSFSTWLFKSLSFTGCSLECFNAMYTVNRYRIFWQLQQKFSTFFIVLFEQFAQLKIAPNPAVENTD